MFTGIVEETGRIEALAPGPGGWRLEISAARAAEGTQAGDSVAVNGCCLTVAGLGGGRLCFDLLEETRRLTNFGRLGPGSRVNLERSLAANGRLGGHFVTGHIDAVGTVEVLEARGADHYLSVRVPEAFGRYLVYKGSVAIDGVSLTVAEADGARLAVWLIPHTLEATALRERIPGQWVNVEFDLLAKYVEKIQSSR